MEGQIDRCRVCGCTELAPCLIGGGAGDPLEFCAWLDAEHTLCSNVRCVAMVPLAELEQMEIPTRLLA